MPEQKRPLSILFVAPYFPPEMGGGAARFSGLARWLARFGNEVTVLTSIPNYPTGIVPQSYRGKFYSCEPMDGVRVLRVWVYASSNRGTVTRLANYASFLLSSLICGVFLRSRFDVIIAGMPPLFTGITGWLLSLWQGVPWVFDIGDLWPDVAVEAGEWDSGARITRLVARLAHFLYRRATHLTPVTARKHQRLVERGISPDKITVVANGADLDQSPGSAGVNHYRQLGLGGCFVIIYAGLMGIAQGADVIVETAALLRENLDIRFLLVGEGVQRESIAERVQELDLHNVVMLPAQPREAILALLRSADAAWVPLVSNDLVDAVPSKLLEAWACSRPVILSASGEAAELVVQARGGIVVAAGDPAGLAEAVLTLKSNPDKVREQGLNGYQYVRAAFNREVLARQMEQVLYRVVGDFSAARHAVERKQ